MGSERTVALTFTQLKDIGNGLATAWPPTMTSIVFAQQTITLAQLQAMAAAQLSPFQAVVNARAALRVALTARAAALPAAEQFVASFYGILPQYIGTNSASEQTFGKQPRKVPAPRTAEQKAEAAAKARATRAARHTMGKNQKKAITGTTASATPAPSPAPAPAPTAAAAIAPAKSP